MQSSGTSKIFRFKSILQYVAFINLSMYPDFRIVRLCLKLSIFTYWCQARIPPLLIFFLKNLILHPFPSMFFLLSMNLCL